MDAPRQTLLFPTGQYHGPHEPEDEPRFGKQLQAVYEVMRSGDWRTIEQIVRQCAGKGVLITSQSVSARLRDLRKEQFGGYTIARKRIGKGLYAYRMEGA